MQSWTETQKMLTLSTHKYIIAWSIKTTIQFLKYLKCKGIFRHTFQVSSYWFLFHLNFFPLPQTINKWLLLFPIFLSTSKIKTATVLTVTQNVGICNMLETEVPQNQPKQPNSTSVKNKPASIYQHVHEFIVHEQWRASMLVFLIQVLETQSDQHLTTKGE